MGHKRVNEKRLPARDNKEQILKERKAEEQAKLALTALTAIRRKDRVEAIEKITDQQTLLDAAMNDSGFEVRIAVAKRLTDQEKLAAFILKEFRPGVYRIACDKLTDQKTIAYIAKRAGTISEYLIREKLTDQKELAIIAKSDPKKENRHAALTKLTDEQAIIEAIKREKTRKDRIYAYSKTKMYNHVIYMCIIEILSKNLSLERRKYNANRLIELLKTDKFAANLFWSDMAILCDREHTDIKAIIDTSDDCGGRFTPHADWGLGVRFPPYPYND
jgi:hypothetical protein